MADPLSGGCFCGAVRYEAGAVFDAGYCHCSVCRRISGAPAAAWFSVRDEHFALTRGEPRALASSEHFVRYFCAACGTHLYGRDDLPVPPKVGSKLVSAMLGTLDHPEKVAPRVHQWWSGRMPSVAQALELDTFEHGRISHPAERLSAAVSQGPAASLDHVILKVNDLAESVAFYTRILGFTVEGTEGPFTLVRAGPALQLQLAAWGTPGSEHYAFAVSQTAFAQIFTRIRAAGIAHGPTFDSVGANTGPGAEAGARGLAPTLYFNDPNRHLLEIRSYAPEVAPDRGAFHDR